MRIRSASVAAFVLLATGFGLKAQDTRTEEIQRARQERKKTLAPDEVSGAERLLRRIKDEKVLERFSEGYNGLRVKLGGMVTGGGFGIGPEYLRQDLMTGKMTFRTSAQMSIKGYQKLDTQLSWPRIANNRAFFEIYGVHHNYPGINYYGAGPDSQKGGRSNYRLEDTSVDGTFGARIAGPLRLGVSAGHLWMNIGPGTDKRFVSAERIYTPVDSPGIDTQTNFLRYGVFGQIDYRDDPFGPRNGGNYVVQYSQFQDRQLGRHDFRRLDIDLQQYLGFFNKRRVIALRGRTMLTEAPAGQSVPFYMRPILGGSDDLRGFRPFRFSDNNVLVLNGEYRWEAFSGLDVALFADGGKVFARRAQLNFTNLEASVGFGLRFNARNRPFLRLDVGFSHEGFQVWIKFNDIFAQRPFGTSSTQPVF